MQRLPRSFVLYYSVAILSIVLATGIRLLLDPLLGDRFPFATFFVAILGTAAIGGFGPAIAATLLGAVLSATFLLPAEERVVVVQSANRTGLALYLVVGFCMAALGQAMRSSRLKAEEGTRAALRQREELRTTLASIGDAVLVVDREGRVVSLNPVAEKLTGWTAGEAAGQSIEKVFVIVNEATRLPAEDPVKRVLTEGVIVGLANHTVLIGRDGRECPIDDSAAPVRQGDGQLTGVVLVFRDVSERRRADEVRGRLAAIVESSDDAIVGKDLDGIITSWNAGAERLYGYTAEEAIGTPFTTLVPPDRRDEAEEAARRLREGERLDNFETLRQRKDGALIHVSVTYSPIRDSDGRLIGTSVITRDISERKRAEAESLAWQRHLQFVADSAPVMLAHLDTENRFKFVNRPYAARFGLEPRQIIGRTVTEVLGPQAQAVIAPSVEKVLQGLPVEFESEVPYRDIGTRHMRWAYAPEFDGDGRVVGYVAVISDVTDARRVERALAASERRFRTLTDHAPVGIFLADPEGNCLFVNRRWSELTGLSVIDAQGQGWARALHPDDRDRVFRGWSVAAQNGREFTGDSRFVTPDGRVVWVRGNAITLRNESGASEGLVGTVIDTTEQTLARAAIEESEQRFRQLADSMPQIVYQSDANGRAEYYNRRWYELTGLEEGAGDGIAWEEFVHPDDFAPLTERWSESIRSGTALEAELRLKNRDGEYRWYLTRCVPVRDGEGRVARWYGTSTDIHQWKLTEAALRASEERLRQREADARFLADASATLAGLVDDRSTLQKVARLAVPHFADWAAVDILENGELKRLAVAHIDPEKVELARELHRRFPPDPNAPRGVWEIVRTGKSTLVPEITEELLATSVQDPEYLRILRELGLRSYMGVPLSVRDKILGVVTFISAESGRRYTSEDLALAEDLANRAAVAIENSRLYQDVREADRRKDEFLAVLGHELRNPLAPISNALQILKTPGTGGRVLEQARQLMERQVQHMVRLVDDLLDVSRIVQGKIELRMEAVDVATIVARAVEISLPLIEAEGHHLTVILPPEPLRVNGDVTRLAQVIGNLLNNAARYTERPGRIRVSAARDGNVVSIRIRDTGIGLSSEILPRIWDMFVQADRRIKIARGGMGVGLTLVKSLTELHGGTVHASSEGPGKGSEFVVALPLLADSEPNISKHELAKPSDSPPRRRILVVDDNVDAAESLALLLRLEGHETNVAHDGLTALRLAEAEPPEVAFFDIGMPGMDGYELARQFRSRPQLKGVMLVALTGWGQDEDRRRTREAGFDAHEVKPVSPGSLAALLARVPGTG